MKRDVSSRITLNVTSPADLIFAVAVSDHYQTERESFTATLDGASVDWRVVSDAHGTRLHRLSSGVGRLEVSYEALIIGEGAIAPTSETDLIVYTRPSRYAESDSLGPTANAEFSGITDAAELLASVSSWVGTRLFYVSGSSLPTDGAIRTLLARQGVCRDYVAPERGAPSRTRHPGPPRRRLRTRALSDGFPCGRRGAHRRRLARGRRDHPRAAVDARAHRDRTGCRRRGVPDHRLRSRRPGRTSRSRRSPTSCPTTTSRSSSRSGSPERSGVNLLTSAVSTG